MYKKVTYEIDDVRMVSKYYPGNFGAPGVKRSDRRRRTAEEVRKNNDRIRIRKLQRIILANFREGRTVHLTYRKDERPETMEEAMRQRKEFLKRMRKECRQAGIEWKFIIVTEKGKRGQALHHHMIIEDRTEPIDLLRTISRLWQYGRVTSTKMEEEDDGFATLADYLLKKETKTGNGTSYSRSRNLVIPQPKAELVRRRKWTKEPKAPAGWYIVKGSVWNAYTPGGWPVQRYTMRRIVEKSAGSRKTCARGSFGGLRS